MQTHPAPAFCGRYPDGGGGLRGCQACPDKGVFNCRKIDMLAGYNASQTQRETPCKTAPSEARRETASGNRAASAPECRSMVIRGAPMALQGLRVAGSAAVSGLRLRPSMFLDRRGHARAHNDARTAYSVVLAEDGFRRDGFTGAFALTLNRIENNGYSLSVACIHQAF